MSADMGYDAEEWSRPIASALRGIAPEKVVVICVGNQMRGDDAFAQAVRDALGADFASPVFDGGQAPENELPRAAKLNPEVVLLVDAVDLRAAPGTLRVLDPDELTQDGFDTHTASLTLSAVFLREACGARVLVLAVQPERVGLGDPMSQAVLCAARRAADVLRAMLGGTG